MSYIIEIATTNYCSTMAAVRGGAHRIELCSALSEGGLTPSYGMIKQCRNDFDISLFPIIRPRRGDFLYTDEEFDIIQKDVEFCRQAGCNGIVTGFLKMDGCIDKDRTIRITTLAYPMQVTFHRAFDRCRDPFEGLEDIIEAGCSRILTSGQKPTAPEGVELIHQLVMASANRIIIMPGSGIRKENIAAVAIRTGASEFHSSLRRTVKSKMQYVHPAFATQEDDYHNDAVEKAEVEALIKALGY